MDDWKTPQELARILDMSTAKLAQMRYEGTGPAYMQLSPRKIRYSMAEVERWAVSKTRTSTAVA